MKTTNKTYKSSFRERGSKFIGYLFPAETEKEFQEKLDQLRSKYPDATHHCWAWRLNPAQPKEFSSDDGEPSGTAGLPILNQLKSFDVVSAGIVVVRYYGGTKLGRSGLIEAYGRGAELCLTKAELLTIKPIQMFEIMYPYSEENIIQKSINDYNLSVIHSEYMAKVKLKVACPIENSTKFEKSISAMEHLDIHFESKQEHYIKI
ncbi:IMPACT family protein [Gracilimonas sp. Q87]|uniref:IMPACT family protein n=1 Tax=Gracilimonas sp. Q87 TaxID=3384766 RepID=UPI003984422F